MDAHVASRDRSLPALPGTPSRRLRPVLNRQPHIPTAHLNPQRTTAADSYRKDEKTAGLFRPPRDSYCSYDASRCTAVSLLVTPGLPAAAALPLSKIFLSLLHCIHITFIYNLYSVLSTLLFLTFLLLSPATMPTQLTSTELETVGALF